MGFDASKAIEKLDYDFRPFVNASGVTPEPTGKMVTNFQDRIRNAASVLDKEFDANDKEAMLEFLSGLSREESDKVEGEIDEAYGELTQGRPSLEDILALKDSSYRHYRAYLGSLTGDIINPESSPADLRSSARRTNGGPTLQSVKS